MPEFYGTTPTASAAAAAACYIKGLDPDAEEGEGEEEEEDVPPVWQCKLCPNRDTSRLTKGADSQLVCKCGAVAAGVEMVDQDRAKNCPREKDKSDVADAPPARAQSAPPWAAGDETPEARQRRLKAVKGGTARPHNRKLQAAEMLLGQNAVESQARMDAMEICRDDAPDRGRGQMLLTALAMEVFTKLGGNPNMHQDVQRHIRLEAIRIYQASVRHQACCHKQACLFALSQYNSKALAFGIARHVLTALAAEEAQGSSAASPVTTMASLTTGASTRRDAERLLSELQQLELANKCGRTPQMKILSAVGLIAKWKPGAERCPCDDEWTYQPPTLRHPASVVNYPGEYGKQATADPADRTIKLRRQLQDAADLTCASSDLRIKAAHQLDVPRVVQFMIDANMHVDITAVGLLAATARAMQLPYDPTLSVRAHVPSTYKVSAQVVDEYIATLAKVVELPEDEEDDPPPPTDAPIFG